LLKGLCHRLAVNNNIKHGRLPLDKFLQMKARKVLTVDHGNLIYFLPHLFTNFYILIIFDNNFKIIIHFKIYFILFLVRLFCIINLYLSLILSIVYFKLKIKSLILICI
jgi:hypothetical protein